MVHIGRGTGRPTGYRHAQTALGRGVARGGSRRIAGRVDGLEARQAGCFFFIPAGTVHAIGAGISLVEVQQNVDVIYRLYDYGRPRELHLDDGVAVSHARPNDRAPVNLRGVEDVALLDRTEAPFNLSLRSLNVGEYYVTGASWFIPLSGSGSIDDQPWVAGECWLCDGKMSSSALTWDRR